MNFEKLKTVSWNGVLQNSPLSPPEFVSLRECWRVFSSCWGVDRDGYLTSSSPLPPPVLPMLLGCGSMFMCYLLGKEGTGKELMPGRVCWHPVFFPFIKTLFLLSFQLALSLQAFPV